MNLHRRKRSRLLPLGLTAGLAACLLLVSVQSVWRPKGEHQL